MTTGPLTPSAFANLGRRFSPFQDQVLRNHSVGSRRSSASAELRLCAVMRIKVPSELASACGGGRSYPSGAKPPERLRNAMHAGRVRSKTAPATIDIQE